MREDALLAKFFKSVVFGLGLLTSIPTGMFAAHIHMINHMGPRRFELDLCAPETLVLALAFALIGLCLIGLWLEWRED